MTASNFMWAVVAGRGHSSEQLGRSFTEDLDAKAKVNEHAERLRGEGRTDWFGAVSDLNRPTVIAPPGSTHPMLGWERVYFVLRAGLSATARASASPSSPSAVASSDGFRACATHPS